MGKIKAIIAIVLAAMSIALVGEAEAGEYYDPTAVRVSASCFTFDAAQPNVSRETIDMLASYGWVGVDDTMYSPGCWGN